MSSGTDRTDTEHLVEFIEQDPRVESVREAAGDVSLYLVGGSVRDLLIGRRPKELDFAVEGPVREIALRLDPDARLFPEFGTAEVRLGDVSVDLAMTRSEVYPEPGSLPTVSTAELSEDLSRRDFSVNAMAMAIGDLPSESGHLIDPFQGRRDLDEGILRILHRDSFRDDPTRAFRAARYCSRLDLKPDEDTLDALRTTDLSTVSSDRIAREIELLAGDERPAQALGVLNAWGVVDLNRDALQSAEAAFGLARSDSWRDLVSEVSVAEGLLSDTTLEGARRLLDLPEDPWVQFEAARGEEPAVLLIARALGAEWLDRWPAEWAGVELEITGEDLVRAGIPEGPAIGSGLDAALEDRIRNGPGGRDRELGLALREAERVDGS